MSQIQQDLRLLFIGAGPMAEAMLRGALQSGVSPANICVTNRSNRERLQDLQTRYGVQAVENGVEHAPAISSADVIVLAVQPPDIVPTLEKLRPHMKNGIVAISVAAGVTTAQMEAVAGPSIQIVRCMPNTSSEVLESATLVSYGVSCQAAGQQLGQAVLAMMGEVFEIPEGDMDKVTGVSGCGPAFVYRLIEAMQKGAEALGISPELAERLLLQMMKGASKMMLETGRSAAQLREEVTTPGGVTNAGLQVMEDRDIDGILEDVLRSTWKRGRELGES